MISTGASSLSTPAMSRLSQQPLRTQSTDLSRRKGPSSPTPMSLRNQSREPSRSTKRCLRPSTPTTGHVSNLSSPYVTSAKRQNSRPTTPAVAAAPEDNNRFTRPKTPNGAVKWKLKRLPPSGASRKRSNGQTSCRKDGNKSDLKPSSTPLSNSTGRKSLKRKSKNSAIKMFMSLSPNGGESEVSLVSDKSKVGQDDDDYDVKSSKSRKSSWISTSSKRLRKIIDKVNDRDDNYSSEDDVSVSPSPVKSHRLRFSSMSSGTSQSHSQQNIASQGITSDTKELYQKMVQRIFPKASKDDDGLLAEKDLNGEKDVVIVSEIVGDGSHKRTPICITVGSSSEKESSTSSDEGQGIVLDGTTSRVIS
jgi:hypothetical protein